MTQKIVYLHRKDQNNPGDWWSSPHHYFPNYKGQVIDMLDNPEFIECDLLIVGGGGLFSTADWMKKLWLWDTRIKAKKKIIWGAGLDEEFFTHPIFNSFDHVGIRQKNTPFKFVPCVSCLNPLLDNNNDVRGKDLDTMTNEDKINLSRSGSLGTLIVGSGNGKRAIEGQHMSNFNKMNVVINQLKLHKKIITSSYHVYYWGKLLEKNIKIDYKSKYRKPLGEKFYNIPDNINLKHYRELNMDFAKLVYG
jgi:hypothetical protein